MLYPIIILIASIICVALNIIFNPTQEWYVYVIALIYLIICVIIIDAIVAIIIRKLPEKHFDYHKKVFQNNERQKKFYKFIKVSKWKEKVPELGMFTGLRKKKIDNPNDPSYLNKFILEACYGVIIHYVTFPASFLVILCDFKMYGGGSNLFLTIGLPVAIVN